jgi:hypothetical protein
MASQRKQDILSVLQEDWADYPVRFYRLSSEAQSALLTQQGYARFADLLAHIVAWWQVGYQAVERYLADPSSQPTHYDVDDFNAKAVAEAARLKEEQVLESFEKMRCFLIEFVEGLPDTAFENEKVSNQLGMELAGHLQEHKITEKE